MTGSREKKLKCYIYTRVSTSMQVDGFSLEAQKDKLRKYADFKEMTVAGEYCDEGRSGKSIEGRMEFLQMLNDIESGKDDVDFVLVFKLSRFGRNAADVLVSLQRMQDFGVNLICVEDGIDSSKDSGKLMISVLSAVAEIERENILVQTMEGRKQKAREGKWNGGFAPYGYKLDDGELKIADDEIEVIKLIFDKFIHTTMGVGAVAEYLNEHGYKKKKRQNNTLDAFSAGFIKGVLDNPVYCGKLAFGRRKTEKIPGTRNDYHIVKQDTYMINEGVHEAIVSEEDWLQAQEKRKATGVKQPKKHSLDHEHILSGIVKCPVCGAGMYGNVNRKKKADGTIYKDHFYYACKHRRTRSGHRCDYHKQWHQEIINGAVEEVIRKLTDNKNFEKQLRDKINTEVDVTEQEKELEEYKKTLRQLNGAKEKLGTEQDRLEVTDRHYDRKYRDMTDRLDRLYDQIDDMEEKIQDVRERISNIRQEKLSADNIYNYLICFNDLYHNLSDLEKKQFMSAFVDSVELYPEKQETGQILKSIKFKFPLFSNDDEPLTISWDNGNTVETVVLLSKAK